MYLCKALLFVIFHVLMLAIYFMKVIFFLCLELIQLLLPNFILYVYCMLNVLKLCKGQFIVKCLLKL
jgi:hypothetical protein